jgi:hypothetical protein
MTDIEPDESGVVADHNPAEYGDTIAGIRRGLAEARRVSADLLMRCSTRSSADDGLARLGRAI